MHRPASLLAAALVIAGLATTAHAGAGTPTAPESATPDRLDERGGIVLGVGLGWGTGGQADARLGWMVHPRLALYATALAGAAAFEDGGGESFRIVGGGARLWPTRVVFLDARVGRATVRQSYDTFEGLVTEHSRGVGYTAAIGVERFRRGLGIDLSLAVARAPHVHAMFVVLGGTIY